METRWMYLTSEELGALREKVNNVCVISWGAVEKHGLHLPLGTDTLNAERIVKMASDIEPVCLFPTIPFGDMSCGHPSTPVGTISLPMETEMLLLEQLCEQIARHGFNKILIYNGHGGNNAWMSAFLQKQGQKKRNYVVAVLAVRERAVVEMAQYLEANGSGSIPELTPEDEKIVLDHFHSGIPTGHGCFCETAYTMGTAPDSVHLDRLGIEDGRCRHKTDYFKDAGIQIRDYGWFEDYPDSYASEVDPVKCNERIGRAALRFEAERVARGFKVFKEDENLLKWQEARQKNW